MTARLLRSLPQSITWDSICAQIEGSVGLWRGVAALADRLALDASQQRRPGLAASRMAFSSSSASSSAASYKACVALERLPVLAPEPPAHETSYRAWSAAWNAKRFKRLPGSFVDTDAASGPSIGGADGTQQAGGSGSAWVAAARTTAADRSNDVRSLNRRLDSRLFLLVKRAGGGWGFLEGDIDTEASRSSRGVAEAALAVLVGAEEDGAARVDGADDHGETGAKPAEIGDAFYFVGNAPAAHSGDKDETMRFYHRCQLVRPDAFRGEQLMKRGGFEDFAWVGVDEMGSYLQDDSRVDVLRSMA